MILFQSDLLCLLIAIFFSSYFSSILLAFDFFRPRSQESRFKWLKNSDATFLCYYWDLICRKWWRFCFKGASINYVDSILRILDPFPPSLTSLLHLVNPPNSYWCHRSLWIPLSSTIYSIFKSATSFVHHIHTPLTNIKYTDF